jgi:hypothetical protein
MDGDTLLGSATLSNGTATFQTAPLAAGANSVTASYAGDAADAASTSGAVTVEVTPQADDYTLSLSANALSASASKPGTLMLTMTPTGGVATAQSFACAGLPSGWSCSFAPASLSGSTPQSTTITVGAMSAAQASALGSRIQLALVSPFTVLLIGVGTTRRPMRRGRARVSGGRLGILLAVIALTALALPGCGGSDGDKGAQSGTQSGGSQTYTVTVTATGTDSATHSAQFTLTVSS